MKKLSEQMMEVDSLLSQLREAMNVFKLPVKLVTGQDCAFRAKRLHSQINLRINTAKALIKTKFDIVSTKVINLQAQDALPHVETSLRILQDVISVVSKDLNLTQQLSSKDLTDEQADTLIETVGEMIAVTSIKV